MFKVRRKLYLAFKTSSLVCKDCEIKRVEMTLQSCPWTPSGLRAPCATLAFISNGDGKK